MSKLLITGGTGFIGRRVCRALLERDVPLVILDSDPAESAVGELRGLCADGARELVAVVEADISELDQVEEAFGQHTDITHVIHLAAMRTSAVEEDPVSAARVNVVGTANVLEAAARHQVTRVIFVSSEAVYGRSQSHYGSRAVREDDFCPPFEHHFTYGAMKLLGEFLAGKYVSTRGLSVACLRPSVVFGYGRGAGAQSWGESFASSPAIGEKAALPFPSDNRECWIYVDDCAEQAVRLALKTDLEHFVYNSGGESVTCAELAAQVKQHLPEAEISFDNAQPHTPLIDDMDGSRLEREIGFRPRPLSEGLLAHINEARSAAGLALIG